MDCNFQRLDARRYSIDIPMELDGHFLTLDAIVDGKVTEGGGSSVVGGSTSSCFFVVITDHNTSSSAG